MIDVDRYLRLLGVAERPAGIVGLGDTVRRHLCRVPFENLSKLLLVGREGAGRITTAGEFLDGIEHHDLGGTCYVCNPFLHDLLQALGYDVAMYGADMTTPNVHVVLQAKVDEVAYLVDAGFAAPFYEPIRLDRVPFERRHGRFRYVLDRSAPPNDFEMTVMNGDEPVQRYRMHGPAWDFAFFRDIVLDSFQPGRTFMSQLRITKFFENHTMELRDRQVTRYEGAGSRTWRIGSAGELERVVAAEFEMPRAPVREAADVLERLRSHATSAGSAEL